jgi:hypothetical protein
MKEIQLDPEVTLTTLDDYEKELKLLRFEPILLHQN